MASTVWKGYITFGLITIPIRLYAAARTERVSFNQIHQVYLTDFPFVTLYAPVDIAVVKSTGHNYVTGSMGASESVNVMNWWCTGGKC